MPVVQFCTFYLDWLLFGVELTGVPEVIRSLEMTRVPLALAVVSGLINLRGQIVPAVDLRRRLELEVRAQDALPMNVVVRSEDGVGSFLVDEIGDVVEVEDSTFERAPSIYCWPFSRSPSALRSTETLALMLFSSTTASGQTCRSRASLVTRCPAFSTNIRNVSNTLRRMDT
jgi:purine-binding chemotaxis protein CheW